MSYHGGVWKLAAILPLVLACSGGPPSSETSAPGRSGGETTAAEGPSGTAIEVEGELGDCRPEGVWRARGSFPGTGDCAELPDAVDLEIEVARTEAGFALAVRGAGEITGDRLAAARGGGCAVGFTIRRGGERLFAHLVDGGEGGARGRGALDRVAADGEISCTAEVVFAVERR